jgi:hypothetical protein
MSLEIVAGWTGPVDFALKSDGAPINLAGITVTMLLNGNDGVSVDTVGDVAVLDPVAGTVRYIPDASDLSSAKSPYRARFRLTDGTGAVVYVPSSGRDVWKVVAA